MAFRSEFREALTLLARGIARMTEQGYEPPVLVGGAAVEIYTSGAVASGDFDLVTPNQGALHEALKAEGFEPVSEPGMLKGGLWHRKLGFGVQVVSGLLMDGKVSRDRFFVLNIENVPVRVITVEDLIADRLGQAYSSHPPLKDMLDQAVKLYALAEDADDDYLDRESAKKQPVVLT